MVTRGLKPTPYQNPNITIGKPTIVIIPEYKVSVQLHKVADTYRYTACKTTWLHLFFRKFMGTNGCGLAKGILYRSCRHRTL